LKPHIRFEKGYHYVIYKDRESRVPIALTSNPRRLPKIGPWRQQMTKEEWFGAPQPPG
jgi:hypothetical protein